jgi:hypothetical protein
MQHSGAVAGQFGVAPSGAGPFGQSVGDDRALMSAVTGPCRVSAQRVDPIEGLGPATAVLHPSMHTPG